MTNKQGWTKGPQGKSAIDPSNGPGRATQPAIAIVRNGNPKQLVDAAIEALGGMSSFVSKGDRVLVKPNIGWDRKAELAATTNPDAVARVVELCIKAGAKRCPIKGLAAIRVNAIGESRNPDNQLLLESTNSGYG